MQDFVKLTGVLIRRRHYRNAGDRLCPQEVVRIQLRFRLWGECVRNDAHPGRRMDLLTLSRLYAPSEPHTIIDRSVASAWPDVVRLRWLQHVGS